MKRLKSAWSVQILGLDDRPRLYLTLLPAICMMSLQNTSNRSINQIALLNRQEVQGPVEAVAI